MEIFPGSFFASAISCGRVETPSLALTAMIGADGVKAEVAKLNAQYGEEKVKMWIEVFDYVVKDALQMATQAGVKLPKGNLSGKKLASTLVMAGLDKSRTFYTCTLLDKAVTHKIHEAVMGNIDKKFGTDANANYHAITNQAMTDLLGDHVDLFVGAPMEEKGLVRLLSGKDGRVLRTYEPPVPAGSFGW